MPIFDDIISGVAQEDRAILDKYPQLRSTVEKLERDFSTAADFAGRWVNWQQQSWDDQAGMTKEEKRLHDELEAAQRQLADAQKTGSGASAAEIGQLRKDFESKLTEIQTANQRTIDGMSAFWGRASLKMQAHPQEFGEIFDPQKLLDYMAANRLNDPNVAYDQMMAPKRQEIAATKQKELEVKHAADLEAARQEGYNKRAQEVAMGPGGAMPTDHTGGIVGVTAPIAKPAQVSDAVKEAVAGAKVGDGSLAQVGYGMYLRGELPTQ